MAVRWDFLWFCGSGRSQLGDSMANEGEFHEQGAYERPPIWPGVQRPLAMGLSLLGTGIVPIGIWADSVLVVTVGMIGVIGGVVWRLWLTLPDP
jgi:hypothetical protein